jgi:hypothetical protein
MRNERLGFYWQVEVKRGPFGKSLGLEDTVDFFHNLFIDEGERNVLDVYFRNQNASATFYMGLHSGSLATNATLANVSEPGQADYARQLLNRNTTDWPTLSFDGADWSVTSKNVVFAPSSTWLPVNRLFLASQSSGAIGSVILEAPLAALRALVSQDTLTITATVKAKEA